MSPLPEFRPTHGTLPTSKEKSLSLSLSSLSLSLSLSISLSLSLSLSHKPLSVPRSIYMDSSEEPLKTSTEDLF